MSAIISFPSKRPAGSFTQRDAIVPAQTGETSWKHVSIALAPVIARIRRQRELAAEVRQ